MSLGETVLVLVWFGRSRQSMLKQRSLLHSGRADPLETVKIRLSPDMRMPWGAVSTRTLVAKPRFKMIKS